MLSETYRILENPMIIHVPENEPPAGKTIVESRIGEVFGSRILGIFRGDDTIILPGFLDTIEDGDRLVAAIEPEAADIVENISSYKNLRKTPPRISHHSCQTMPASWRPFWHQAQQSRGCRCAN
jgi:uncharacterized protein with PhoU and TrkA domain